MSPPEYFGNTWGEVKYDFYKSTKIFGGMWDAKIINADRNTVAVIEIKTSSRPQDWECGVPDEKLIQALQYARRKGPREHLSLRLSVMITDPVVCPKDENVKLCFTDRLPSCLITSLQPSNFDGVRQAVVGSVCDDWYLPRRLTRREKIKKTDRPDEDVDTPLSTLISLLDAKEMELTFLREQYKLNELEDEIKSLKDALKRTLTDGMGTDSTKVEVGKWTLTKTERETLDTTALKADGLYDKYTKTSVSYTLRKKGEK